MVVAVTVALLLLGLMVAISEALLEENCDIVCDAQEVLVALRLCCLEPPGDMAADKGHRHGVGCTGAMDGLGLGGRKDCFWGENEGTRRLTPMARVRHGPRLTRR